MIYWKVKRFLLTEYPHHKKPSAAQKQTMKGEATPILAYLY